MIRLLFLVVTPLGKEVSFRIEGLNDEPAHLNYVKYLAEHHQFPVQTESTRSPDAFKHNVFEYYQPPLYYLLCAPVYPVLGEKGTLYWGRALSFIFGVLTLLVVFDILKLLKFSGKDFVLPVAFASLQLSHVYFCSMLSNDSLSWLTGILIVNLLLRKITSDTPKLSIDIWIGVLLATGLLVKSSLAMLLPVYAVVLIADFIRQGKKIPVRQCIVLLAAVAVAAPWYARNYLLYSSVFAFEVGFGPTDVSYLHLQNVHTALNATIKYFFFPMQHIPVTMAYKLINYAGVALIVAHVSLVFRHLVMLFRTERAYRLLVLIVALAVVSYVSLLTKWFNAEGRYLFTAFGPIVLLLFPAGFRAMASWRYLKIIAGVEIVFGYLYFLLV
ncbi:MAG TPA: hypothetical protein VHO70_03305 [Chitinispirillaceae bacterium]|nr:hypothetical protein [Chitinispirillaceae bacterium]